MSCLAGCSQCPQSLAQSLVRTIESIQMSICRVFQGLSGCWGRGMYKAVLDSLAAATQDSLNQVFVMWTVLHDQFSELALRDPTRVGKQAGFLKVLYSTVTLVALDGQAHIFCADAFISASIAGCRQNRAATKSAPCMVPPPSPADQAQMF